MRKEFDLEKAINLYESGLTMQQVATELGYRSHVTVLKQFKRAGYPIRSRSEAQTLSYSTASRDFPDRSGENNPAWRGGIKVEKGRYILQHVPEHPDANSQGYVRWHRLVVEQKLGRHLSPTEVVHHINGNTFDNRPENLELLDSHAEHMSLHAREAPRNSMGQFVATSEL